MKIFKITYAVLSLVWLIISGFVLPSTGEAGLLPAIITLVITAPIGILFGYVANSFNIGLPGEIGSIVFTAVALGLAYIQWVLIIQLIQKIRNRRD